MSKLVLNDAGVSIAGIDAGNNTRSVQIELTAEEIDITPLGTGPYRITMAGERLAQVSVDVFATKNSSLEQALRNAYNAGAAIDVQFRPQAHQSQSPTNPTVDVSCVVVGFAPFGGAVGEAAKAMVRLAAVGAVTIDEDLMDALILGGLLIVEG
jgi:hypothetical protein